MDPARKVEPEKLEAILAAGRAAPTAKNMQPQRIFVLQSPEALQLAEELTICTFHAPVILVICADRDQAWKHYLTGETRAETDAAIVTTHMMLAAHALGLGSTWVARFDTALAAEKLGLPASVTPYAMLPIGYPALDAPASPNHGVRKPLSDTVTYL
jgi:nitroreductase